MSQERVMRGGWVDRKNIPRGPNGRGLCRWCSLEVPPRRFTFCSEYCVHEWKLRSQPGYLRDQVFLRDKGVCASCGVDTVPEQRRLRYSRGKNRIALMAHWGLRKKVRKSLWDADHILPVAEGGGECDLENIRTLCLRCHREATKRLRERTAKRRDKALSSARREMKSAQATLVIGAASYPLAAPSTARVERHADAVRRSESMAQVSIPESCVAPMEHFAAGITGLRLAFVNVFAVSHPDGSWTLVDAGLPFSSGLIGGWAERRFRNPPTAIVLTHGHFDHVSAARELAEKWDIPIFAHPLEFPYLTGKQTYPAPDFSASGGLMSLLSPLYPTKPVDLGERLQPLPSQQVPGSLMAMPNWTIVHTPGHTPGHVSFFRPTDRLMIAGDAFCTTKPESFFDAAITQTPELHGPPAYFTQDWDAASESIQKLAELDPLIVAPGHGKPLVGEEVAGHLRQLAEQFATRRDNNRAVA